MSLLRIFGQIMRSLGVGSQRPQLSREEAFAARPLRNPSLKWRVNDQECVEVIIPRRQDRLGRIMGWVFAVPESRPVLLDEVGTFIWNRWDGENTVADLVAALCEEYKLGRREVEVSLTEYLRMLGKRGMIAFLLPQDALARDEAGGEGEEAGDEERPDEPPAPTGGAQE